MKMSSVLANKTETKNVIGSMDHREPAEQMRAIDLAMQIYFGSKNWLAVRRG